jgi:hypothetical protein
MRMLSGNTSALEPAPDAAPATTGYPPFVLCARLSGLAPQALDALRAPRTLAALGREAAARTAAERLGVQLGAALHDAVPSLDQAARRAALRIRRGVHNARPVADADLVARLPEPSRIRYEQWRARMADAERHAAKADACCAAELREAAAATLRALRQPAVLAGLALAGPQFVEELLGTAAADLRPGSRIGRSAFAYLCRTAVKTSPFSTLTTLAAAGFEATGPAVGSAAGPAPAGPAGAAALRTVSPALAMAVEVRRAFAVHPGPAEALPVLGNPSVRRVDGRWLAMVPRYFCAAGYFFREDEVADVGLYEPVIGVLPRVPTPLGDWVAGLSGAGDGALAFGRRLVETGLLLPVVPWNDADPAPFAALREQLDPAGAAAAVRELASAERDLATAGGVRSRIAAERRLRAAGRRTVEATGRPAPHWFADAPTYHEFLADPDAPDVLLPEPVRGDLCRLADELAGTVVRAPLYDELVRRFVLRYGDGGRCTDLLDFLYACTPQEPVPPLPPARAAAPAEPPAPRGHGTLSPVAHTVFFQIAAEDRDAVAAGAYRLVVNRVCQGVGGLIGRWAAIPALRDRLFAGLDHWHRAAYQGRRVYRLSAGADWASAQRLAPGRPRLAWPSDLPSTAADPDSVPLSELTLVHDRHDGTLQAYGPGDEPVAFTYFGVTPEHLLSGPVRALLTLTDPWITLARVDAERRAYDPPRPSGDGVSFTPRTVRGRLVLSRARWRVPATLLPRPAAGETAAGGSAARLLARADRWRRAHGLPAEVYWSAGYPDGTRTKPMWLAFDSPAALWALHKAVRPDQPAVDLVEALPGSGQHWYRDGTGRSRTLELCALIGPGVPR